MGIVVLYYHKDSFLSLNNNEQEKANEEKRKANFSTRFPTLHSIPLVRSASTWVYKEGCLLVLFLTLLIIYGSVLRVLNLGETALYQDEIIQYQALLGLIEHGNLAIYNPFGEELLRLYTRNALLTYIVYMFVTIFGENEFIFRFPSAIIGILLIPVFYLCTKNLMGKQLALLGAVFITFNPFLIYFSRFYRNYSFLAFFYFLTIVIIVYFVKELSSNKPNTKRLVKYSILGLLAFVITHLFGTVQAMTLIPVIMIGIALVIIWTLSNKYLSIKVIYTSLKIVVLISIIVLIDLIIGYDTIGLASAVQVHLKTDIFYLFSSSNARIYFNYLFSFNYGSISFILITVAIFKTIYSKRIEYAFIIASFFCSFILISYLGDRYEDFRYIAFLLPLSIIVILISIDFFIHIVRNLQLKNVFLRNNLVILAALALITYQVPFEIDQESRTANYFAKGQPWWEENEGFMYIHRRAVNPEYNKAFDYINSHSLKKDIFIFHNQGYMYLEKLPGQDIFYIGRNTNKVQSLTESDATPVPFQEFLKEHRCSNIWFIGTHIHFIDNEVTDFLFNPAQFENIGQKIGIKEFNYLLWYEKHDTTWPTVLRREKRDIEN